MRSDPQRVHNLSAEAQHAEVLLRMRLQLTARLAQLRTLDLDYEPPMTNDRPSSIPWPPLILAAVVLGGWALGRQAPLPFAGAPVAPALKFIGIGMIALALLVDFLTMREMARAQTTVMPHRGASDLVTTGPFRRSRNPIYVANVAILAGLGLARGNLWWVLGAGLAGLLIGALAVRGEEAHLERQFGEEYRRYCVAVRRWL